MRRAASSRWRTNMKYLALATAAMLVAGCSGNGSAIPAMVGPAVGGATSLQSAHREKAHARVEIRIPRHRRRSRFVSPNTQSMTLSINGKTPVTYALTPASPGCTTLDGATQCVFTTLIPSGTDTFSVATFSTPDATGPALSFGTVVQSVAPGTLAAIPLTLEGMVKSIKVALGNSAPPAGTAATERVYVTAYDPSGAAIIGPGSYGNAITLSDSDSSGITTLSTTSVTAPSQKVTLAYTGHSILSATIGATATNVSPLNVTTA